MKFKDESQVKKWLRQLPLLRKELELKIEFYKELAEEFDKAKDFPNAVYRYQKRVEVLKNEIDTALADVERLFGMLSEEERLIMTAKYIKLVKWDFIEMHTYYSRRHAIRIHNAALKKLVGQEVASLKNTVLRQDFKK